MTQLKKEIADTHLNNIVDDIQNGLPDAYLIDADTIKPDDSATMYGVQFHIKTSDAEPLNVAGVQLFGYLETYRKWIEGRATNPMQFNYTVRAVRGGFGFTVLGKLHIDKVLKS